MKFDLIHFFSWFYDVMMDEEKSSCCRERDENQCIPIPGSNDDGKRMEKGWLDSHKYTRGWILLQLSQPVFSLTHSFKKWENEKKNEWITQTLVVLTIFLHPLSLSTSFWLQVQFCFKYLLQLVNVCFTFSLFLKLIFFQHLLATSYQYWDRNAMGRKGENEEDDLTHSLTH